MAPKVWLHLVSMVFLLLVHQPPAMLPSLPPPPPPPPPAAAAPLPRCVAARLQLGAWSAAQEAAPHARRRPLAFAVPVHPPTFHFTLDLLYARHLQPAQFDLFLVFTTPDDAALYRDFLAAAPRQQPNSSLEFLGEQRRAQPPAWERLYAPLVLQWPCHSSVDLADRKVIITAKKLFALAALHACYDLMTTTDAETSVIRPARVLAAVRAAAESRAVVASAVPGYSDMVQHSVGMFHAPHDAERIRALTRDYTLWTWWNDVPVWRAADVPAFLRYIDFPARTPQEFREFDHMTYTLWRVLHRNATLVAIAPPGLDGPFGNTAQPSHWLAAAAAAPPGPAWMTLHFCRSNRAFCASQGAIALLHHLDRGDTPWWRSAWDPGHMPAVVEDAPAADTPHCGLAGSTRLTTPLAASE